MNDALPVSRLKGYRFRREIMATQCASTWRFSLSLREVEELLAERGVIVSNETIRAWVAKFGTQFAAMIRGGDRPRLSDKWRLDEVLIRIGGGPTGSGGQSTPTARRSSS